MNSDSTGPINLGNPTEISIFDLAKRIRDRIDPDLPLVWKDLPEDDPKQRCPVITKAKLQLDWEPKTSFDTGLRHTIEYFQYLVNHANPPKIECI